MSSAEIILIITTTVTGLVTIIAAVSAAIAANRATVISTATDHKADTLIRKTNDIHDLANGNLSRAIESLSVANKEIANLKTEIRLLNDKFELLLKVKNAS